MALSWLDGRAAWGWKALAAAVAVPVCLRMAYLAFFRVNKLDSPDFYNNKSEKFLLMRRKKYPPGFPRGWYCLASLSELEKGKIKNISCLGIELVAFMDNEGKVAVLDAHCPHLGAHLGCGGKLVNGTIECPYHGWQFDTDGKCVKIPYTDAPVPSSAKARVHHTAVFAGVVFVWFDSEGGEPTWEMYRNPDLTGGMVYHRMYQSQFNMHVCEMAENSPDYYHFTSMHGKLPIPIASYFFAPRYDTKMYFDETRPHIEMFDNTATTYFLNYPLNFTTTLTRVTFEGPAVIHFEIFTDLGRIRLLKTLVPVEDFHIYAEDRWFAEPSVPRWLVWIVSKIAGGALEQDRPVWENKLFDKRPILVRGDGPFRDHRKWWIQFYNAAQLENTEHDGSW